MKIKKRKERKTIVSRFTCSVAEIPAKLEAAYGEVMSAMKTQKLVPVGPPFALYHNDDMDALDIEAGMPVPKRAREQGEVHPSVLPAGRYIVARHKGPYDQLERTYNDILAFAKEKGLEPQGLTYEIYLNDPGKKKPEALKTDVYFLLAD
jgi:effector-binding domain-containing protein